MLVLQKKKKKGAGVGALLVAILCAAAIPLVACPQSSPAEQVDIVLMRLSDENLSKRIVSLSSMIKIEILLGILTDARQSVVAAVLTARVISVPKPSP